MSELLKKITTRNYIAILLTTLLAYGVYKGLNTPTIIAEALKDPIVTYILGTFNTGVLLVLYFYFRKPQAKESN